MEVYSFSAKGKRENNEDYLSNRQLAPGCSLFLVADGMGGYLHGEIASSLACETIAEYIVANYGIIENTQLIPESLSLANHKINEKRKELATKMGTTIAGVLIEGSKSYFFWLGDVRIYHFQKDEILFQSEDHSLISDMKKQRNVSVKEIERYGNIVTRSLTGSPFEQVPPIIISMLKPGDIILLCTDGLWKNKSITSLIDLPESEIQNCLLPLESTNDDNYSLLRLTF